MDFLILVSRRGVFGGLNKKEIPPTWQLRSATHEARSGSWKLQLPALSSTAQHSTRGSCFSPSTCLSAWVYTKNPPKKIRQHHRSAFFIHFNVVLCFSFHHIALESQRKVRRCSPGCFLLGVYGRVVPRVEPTNPWECQQLGNRKRNRRDLSNSLTTMTTTTAICNGTLRLVKGLFFFSPSFSCLFFFVSSTHRLAVGSLRSLAARIGLTPFCGGLLLFISSPRGGLYDFNVSAVEAQGLDVISGF